MWSRVDQTLISIRRWLTGTVAWNLQRRMKLGTKSHVYDVLNWLMQQRLSFASCRNVLPRLPFTHLHESPACAQYNLLHSDVCSCHLNNLTCDPAFAYHDVVSFTGLSADAIRGMLSNDLGDFDVTWRMQLPLADSHANTRTQICGHFSRRCKDKHQRATCGVIVLACMHKMLVYLQTAWLAPGWTFTDQHQSLDTDTFPQASSTRSVKHQRDSQTVSNRNLNNSDAKDSLLNQVWGGNAQATTNNSFATHLWRVHQVISYQLWRYLPWKPWMLLWCATMCKMPSVAFIHVQVSCE